MLRSVDVAGRALALLIFLVGVALLGWVFYEAYRMLMHPVPGLNQALTAAAAPKTGAEGSSGLTSVAGVILTFVLHLAVLLLMTLAAGMIAARGVHLYFGALGHHHAPVSPPDAPDPAAKSGPGGLQ